MALLNCDFFSESLQVGTSMTVLLPQSTTAQIGVRPASRATAFPVLYLLHGLSDDHTAWVRYTSIERYANAAGIAVVMPAVHRSFYADEAQGHSYWTFVSQELPSVVADFFAVSTDRRDTYVAGLSMGGYGALKLGFRHPDRFAAVAALSAVADIQALVADPRRRDLLHRVFGPTIGPDDDLLALAKAVDPVAAPAFYISCGTQDELLDGNRRLISVLTERGVKVKTALPPGDHEWKLWDAQIAEVIDWLPRRSGAPSPVAPTP